MSLNQVIAACGGGTKRPRLDWGRILSSDRVIKNSSIELYRHVLRVAAGRLENDNLIKLSNDLELDKLDTLPEELKVSSLPEEIYGEETTRIALRLLKKVKEFEGLKRSKRPPSIQKHILDPVLGVRQRQCPLRRTLQLKWGTLLLRFPS